MSEPDPQRHVTGPPASLPIGLHLGRVSRQVARAFDEALGRAGGSLPVWIVLLNIKIRGGAKQRDLATAVGVSEATMTHHLTALEREGLVRRERDPSNRRVQLVELTDAGEERFVQLRDAALAFDAQLRKPFTAAELETLAELLERLRTTVTPAGDEPPPFAGLIEGSKR